MCAQSFQIWKTLITFSVQRKSSCRASPLQKFSRPLQKICMGMENVAGGFRVKDSTVLLEALVTYAQENFENTISNFESIEEAILEVVPKDRDLGLSNYIKAHNLSEVAPRDYLSFGEVQLPC